MSKQLTPIQALKGDIQKMEGQFKSALPSHIPVEKFVRVIQTAIGNTPALANAERNSLFGAAMKSAQDGLLPDGREAAIVTYRNKQGQNIANYLPMVGGILKKVRNSGELSSITSQIVYENDEFEFFVDEDGEHLKHKPIMFGDRGKPIGVYALAKTKDGGIYMEVMSMGEINAIKNASRGKNGPWSGDFEHEMWRKSAIKRLSKRLPMSTDIEMTIRADDELYDFEAKPAPKEEAVVPQEEDAIEVEVVEAKPVKKDKTKPNKLKETMSKEAAQDVEQVYQGEIPQDEVPI